MHDHNDGKGNNSMMWMMAICCGLPLLLILFVGVGGKALGASTWVVFGGMALMILAHFFMMRKHKNSDTSNEEQDLIKKEDKNTNNNKSHSSNDSCH